MRTSTIELEIPNAENIRVTDDTLSVDLSDGRTISMPLLWYPRLAHAKPTESNVALNWQGDWHLLGRY